MRVIFIQLVAALVISLSGCGDNSIESKSSNTGPSSSPGTSILTNSIPTDPSSLPVSPSSIPVSPSALPPSQTSQPSQYATRAARERKPGRVGIANLGATCYLAASLQALGHSTRIRRTLETTNFTSSNHVQSAFVKIIGDMWDPSGTGEVLDPTELVNALFNQSGNGRRFHPHTMEDAYEAMTLIFQSVISAAQSVVNEETPFHRLMGITINRRQTCFGCNVARGTIAQDTALEFTVGIPAPAIEGGAVSLYDCLETRTDPEGIYQVFCNSCGGRHFAVFQPTSISVGDVFLVVLRRFDALMNKINTEVDIPLVLDMARVTLDANVPNYNLVAVVHHLGNSLQTGHYVTDYFDSEKNEWVRANDGSLTSFNGPPQSVSKTAYLLIYERPAS